MVTEVTPAAESPSMATVAVIPPKAPQIFHPQSRNSTIGTIAIPIAATSITATQAPPVCNPVSITNILPPGYTMVGNNKGLLKTILLGATGQCTPAAQPTPQPANYTPTFAMPFGNNGPWFPTAPGSWGFGLHAAAYQCINNIPPSQPETSMIHDDEYHGVQVRPSWHHARTSCIWSAQSWSEFLPEPLLMVRGSQ
jgi:hypothetical protein